MKDDKLKVIQAVENSRNDPEHVKIDVRGERFTLWVSDTVKVSGDIEDGDPSDISLQYQNSFGEWVKLPITKEEKKQIMEFAQYFICY